MDDATYWLRVQARTAQLRPDMARAVLRAFQKIRDTLTEAELERFIRQGTADAIIDHLLSDQRLDPQFASVQREILRDVEQGVNYFGPQVPRASASIAFNVLNPNVLTALDTLNTKVVEQLKADLRTLVRGGIVDGDGPRDIARKMRSMIGLGPTQVQEVQNFAEALRRLGFPNARNPFDYAKRDKRFDATLKRWLKEGPADTAAKQAKRAAQIDKMVATYTKNRIALNAESIARTAVLDSFKRAQELSWQQAMEQGFIDPTRVTKRWMGVMDSRERDEHRAMEGQTVPFASPYSNGERIPGESTYGCRCLSRYHQTPLVEA